MRLDAADIHYASEDLAKHLLRLRAREVLPLISTGTVLAAVDGFLLCKLGSTGFDAESAALHTAVMGKLVDAAEGA